MEIRKCIFGEGESQLEGESFLFFFFRNKRRKCTKNELFRSRSQQSPLKRLSVRKIKGWGRERKRLSWRVRKLRYPN